ASVPSLWGDNNAVFSLTLSQEGATIVEQAFQQRATPIGVIYDLRFTGIRPSLDVKITVDYKRVYDQFSASISGQYYWFRGSIDVQIETLRQTGAIQIEVTNYTDDDDSKKKEDWAIQFFTDKLLNDWFEPTLTLGTLQGGGDLPMPTRAGSMNAPTPSPTGTHAAMRAIHTAQDAAGAVHFQIMSRDPDPSPAGFDVTHTPAPSGTVERITVTGGRAPRVTVDGVDRPLDASRQVSIDVANGTSHEIVVDDPAGQARQEDFFLFFDFDKPFETWVAGSPGTNANYRSYLANGPNPADARFTNNSTHGTEAPGTTRPQPDPETNVPAPHGADGLVAWLNTLADPKNVTVVGHASYEGGTTGASREAQHAHNQRLSGRRIDVA